MYIVIDQEHAAETTYQIDSPEEEKRAREALREAGIPSAPVYAGEGEDSYRTGTILWAAQ